MNHWILQGGIVLKGVPHARGDEPKIGKGDKPPATVFPTRVGMNRIIEAYGCAFTSVPHARGDEPN